LAFAGCPTPLPASIPSNLPGSGHIKDLLGLLDVSNTSIPPDIMAQGPEVEGYTQLEDYNDSHEA
jgi:hypothetical protein